MAKIYVVIIFFIGFFGADKLYAQAPALSYPTPQTFAVGQPIVPIPVNNTGAPVPNGFYASSSTIAGNGSYGNTNADAYTSSFGNPVGITMDPSGNIFIADANNNAIRKLSPDGTVTTFAGGGAAGSTDGIGTAAKFNYPTGLASDKNGYIYVADFSNSRIRKIFPNGEVTTLASTGFSLPYGLAVDAAGNVIVADTYNNMIKKITPAGVVSVIAGNATTSPLTDGNGTAANFSLPYGVVLDAAGNIYVTDRNHNAIRKITPAGDVTTLSHNSNTNKPTGITIDNGGTLYVTNGFGFISKVKPNGETTIFAGADSVHNDGVTFKEGLDTAGRYSINAGISIDPEGYLIIADAQNFLIRQVSLIGYAAPVLPHGLHIDTLGTIFGTPDSLSAARNYTVNGYTINSQDGTDINIAVANIAPQTITFNSIPDKVYGTADLANLATSSNSTIPIIYTSSNAAVATIVNNNVHIVGVGTTNITANQMGGPNFTPSAPVTRPLTVTKATATITAANQVKITGQDNPVFTVNYTDFVNGDDNSVLTTKPILQTTATTASAAGTYPITASGAVANNYMFTYVTGTLTVSASPVVVTGGSTAFLAGDSVILSVNYPPGYTYQWNYNGSVITGATNSSYKATISGAYTVSITANGKTVTSSVTNVTAAFTLPVQNFKLQINAVTCKGSNNGKVFITAVTHLNYTAVVVDASNVSTSYPFTDTVTISKLKPGTYNICITVSGQTYSQCYSVNITEPKDLTVFSTINHTLNTVTLKMDGATSYKINVNGTVYTINQNDVTLPLVTGTNKIAVTTDQLCQGIIEKTIFINNYMPYPNPFTDVLKINIGYSNTKNVEATVYNVVTGKKVFNNNYVNQSGVVQLDLKDLDSGIYYLNLTIDNSISSFKILKK